MKEFTGKYILVDKKFNASYLVNKIVSISYDTVRIYLEGEYSTSSLLNNHGLRNLYDYEINNEYNESSFTLIASRIFLISIEDKWVEFKFHIIMNHEENGIGEYLSLVFKDGMKEKETKKSNVYRKDKSCLDCFHQYHCPMMQAGYSYDPDTCPYNEDNEKDKITQPIKSIDDLECLVETIIEDSGLPYKDIVDSLNKMSVIYSKKIDDEND